MTSSRAFVDTNVLVYSADVSQPAKREAARRYLKELLEQRLAVISTQVLQEFYVVATRKGGLAPQHAREMLRHFRRDFQIISVTPDLIETAIDCSIISQLSFWDALLIACAAATNCNELWTEDLNPGQTINGVKIVNPFA
jgi:predicted nucleic acid-binding protein